MGDGAVCEPHPDRGVQTLKMSGNTAIIKIVLHRRGETSAPHLELSARGRTKQSDILIFKKLNHKNTRRNPGGAAFRTETLQCHTRKDVLRLRRHPKAAGMKERTTELTPRGEFLLGESKADDRAGKTPARRRTDRGPQQRQQDNLIGKTGRRNTQRRQTATSQTHTPLTQHPHFWKCVL